MTEEDEAAFDEFLAARSTALLRTAILVCGASAHDAEDLVQHALETVPDGSGVLLTSVAPPAPDGDRGPGHDRDSPPTDPDAAPRPGLGPEPHVGAGDRDGGR
ncbi:hypothetical protein [Planomonospora parontospora]|uniref:hypothetical protein n=1 Tax=Planomonospora parontospora TaxID=58119 RepID=UPI00166FF798|nr:hypothetical protein [Planomonospora parontospora]GGL06830.1 hypothetical protein GCM10014719_06170 [Planomonospora parontospora subsp. antibiotica]GII14167.1 hypothetical protein Ppa05_08930 [Planomonospora parontospora subsp. antibiotica]